MKTPTILGLLLTCSLLQAQTINQTGSTANPPTLPAPTTYVAVSRDANSAIWQQTTYEQAPDGSIVPHIHGYTELSTGLNHLVNGQWVASSESIDVSPDGSSAWATNGQHQVYFPGNIYDGVIKLVTPDGKTLQSQPIGLSYFDGSNSVLLAVVTNSTGAILPSGNQVIYSNAFAGLNADLLYNYTKAGFEQDVILREQPPDPVALGLNPQTTRLQMLTEFFNPPQPNVSVTTVSTAAGDLEDDSIDFGTMQMGQGKAFLLGANSPLVGVNKRWLMLQGRPFLIEEVPIVSIARDVDALPPFVGQAGLRTNPVLTKNLQMPQRRMVHATPKSQFLTQARLPSKGLILDYLTLNSSQTNYTFQGDTTYYISGTVNLYGSNSFEGGAVIKYTNNASIIVNITYYGSPTNLYLNWPTSPYRPVIFTAKDDNSVGETLGVSTGTPTNYYANPALQIAVPSSTTLKNPSHFRISYAQQALCLEGPFVVQDGQIVNCQNGIQFGNSTISLENILFANVQTNLNTVSYNYNGSLNIENCTFASSSNLIYAQDWASQNVVANLTNCILANVSNLTNTHTYSFTYQINGNTNGFYHSPAFGTGQTTDNSYPFQTVGAGYYYLTNGCAFTNAGTTNIDLALLADLQQKTIYPPLVISNVASSWTGTNLTPQVQRDPCNPPALGYHYDPLDYFVTRLSAFADDNPILLTNGVAVGLFGNYGFVLNEVCKFVSVGKANAMNRIVWYPSVQEEEPSWLGSTSGSGIFNVSGATSTAMYIPKPQIILHFTDLPMLGTRQNFFYGATYTYNVGAIFMQDCWVRGVSLGVGGYYAAYTNNTTAITFLDNLFERSSVSLYNGYVLQCQHCVYENPLSLTAYNNLFWQSAIGLTYLDSQSWIHPNWTIKDNLFDTTPTYIYADGNWGNYVSTANNAYSDASDVVPGTNDISPLTNLSYALGPLGPWYINSASLTLLYAGSRSAASAGLYHYTIQTNLQWNPIIGTNCEVPDGTNIVSIGYHYVATDVNGNPLDSNGDGIPDYLEDPDGDGIVNNGEYSWNSGIELSGSSLSYIVGSSPKPVDSAAVIVAPNCSNLSNGSLTISVSTNWQPEDTLAINNLGIGAGQVGVTNNVVTYGGTNMGKYSGGSGSNALVISFTNSAATPMVAQAILQNVTYHYYPSTNESLATRTVQFILSDCGGHANFPVTKSIILDCPQMLDLMLVIDHSGSMADTLGGSTDKLDAAKAAAISFITDDMQFTNDQVGLVTFSTVAVNNSGLTNNPSSVINAINGLTTDQYTDIGDGIATAQGDFPTNGVGSNTLAVMILLTDGFPNRPPDAGGTNATNYAILQATTAKQAGTRLITIGLGTNGDFDPNLLTTLASSPDDFIYASNTTMLEPIYHSIGCSLCRPPTNQAPAVQMISPTNGQFFIISPTNIFLSASASEEGRTITNVSFYLGTDLLGSTTVTDADGLYDFIWQDVTNGIYSNITAQATDNQGTTVSSATISIIVNAMPIVSIVSPANLQLFQPVTNVTLSAIASDSDGSITNVQFFYLTNVLYPTNYLTNCLIGTAAPVETNYMATWSNLTTGVYTVVAVATDNRGASSSSYYRVFMVNSTNSPPTVSITSPANYTTFNAWPDVTITANACSSVGIAHVGFYNYGTNYLGTTTNSYTSATATNFEITLHGLPPGNYAFTATATDTASPSNSATSIPVYITVQSSPIFPAQGYWDYSFGNYIPTGDSSIGRALEFDSKGDLLFGGLPQHNGDENNALKCFSSCTLSQARVPVGKINALCVHGSTIYIGIDAGGQDQYIGEWDGTYFVWLGDGLSEPYPSGDPCQGSWLDYEDTIHAIHVMNGNVYIGGEFTATGLLTSNGPNTNIQFIAELIGNSTNWSEVGKSVLNGTVQSIADFDNILYIGGDFTAAGTNTNVRYLAKLVNGDWQSVGGGVNGNVYALTAHNGKLFVGGEFTEAGGLTNANLIACWDGTNWSSINGGLNNGLVPEFQCFPTNRVAGIAVRGNELYATGHFGTAWNGANPIAVNNIARAVWNATSNTWEWYSLDGGLADINDFNTYPYFVNGDAIAIHNLDDNGSYEVVVYGLFNNAGGQPILNTYGNNQQIADNIARWIVGQSDCRTNGPNVYSFWLPWSDGWPNALIDGSQELYFDAGANSTGSNLITRVDFYVDGEFLGTGYNDEDGIWEYYTNCSYLDVFTPGHHTVQATAYDSAGLYAVSAPTPFILTTTGTSPTANDDTYTVLSTAVKNYSTLNVLTNDISSGGPLRIVGLETNYYWAGGIFSGSPITFAGGSFAIGPSGTNIIYTANPYAFGEDFATYSVADSNGTNRAVVTVFVQSQSFVQLTRPADGSIVMAPASFNISGITLNPGAAIQNVQIYVGTNGPPNYPYGSPISPDINGNFSLAWQTTNQGTYTFMAMANAANNVSSFSTTVTVTVTNNSSGSGGINPPVAIINSPTPPVSYMGLRAITNALSITSGFITNLTGSAYDPAGGSVSWQILLYDAADNADGSPINVTPGPLAGGFHTGAVTNGSFGTVNLSGVENGAYTLTLLVQSSGGISTANLSIALNSSLKLGQFSFSQQDLVLPVNGIPLTITRTYNSMNPRSSDFGYGWTFSVNSMDVTLDEQREDWQVGGDTVPADIGGGGSSSLISVRSGGGRDVTLTLPDGRRATFAFSVQPGWPSAQAKWTAPRGVNATLIALGSSEIDYNFYGGMYWHDGGGGSTFDDYDVPGWILNTQPDGTQYKITRGTGHFVICDPIGDGNYVTATVYGAPQLTEIDERSGDTIQINNNGIIHYDSSHDPTRSLYFDRDIQGRIRTICAPNNVAANFPSVRYVYDSSTGNLIQVLKLVDSIAGTYATNSYAYTNTNFPHYITEIDNADGVPVVRNLYDDIGKLIGIIDASGQTNSFVHDLTGHVEIQYDHSSQPTYYFYDLQGNITETEDALGHTNAFAYDSNGYLTNSVDALGNVTSYNNDNNGNALSVTVPYPAGANPSAYTTAYSYDQYGNQTSVTLPTGGVITNTYDSCGNLMTKRDENNNLISSATYNPAGLLAADGDQFGTNSYGYDSAGNMTSFTNSMGGVTTSGYDANGNLTNLTDASGTSSVAYDAMNRETAADYGNGITVSYGFQDDGDWNSISGPTLGNMHRNTDAQGRLSGWTTANGSTPGFAYDADGRLQYETNSIGVVVQSVYNAVGWLVAKTNLTTGAWTAYGYDAAGRKTSETNAYGQVSTFAYWPSGSLMALTNATGTNYWLYSDAAGACSACGNSGAVTDALGRVTMTVTSTHDLPLQTIRMAYAGATGADAATNSITYLAGLTTPEQEAADYPATITDEAGRTRQYGYTALGQLYRATDLSGAAWWTNQFDQNGELTNLLSPTGESLGYAYDSLDNVKTIRFGDGNWRTNLYNAQNRLSGVYLPSGMLLTNFYDFAGRLTNNQVQINGVVTERASFAYNGNDSVTVMTDNTGSTTNCYDAAGRLWGINYPSGGNVRCALDLLDRITAITNRASPGGTAYVTRYQYDSVGNVTNIIDPFNGQTSFTYDQAGRRNTRTLPNGIVTTWQYNWKNQVTNIVHKTSGGTVLASVYYIRAAGGEPTQITREDGTYVMLAYDAALRLTNEIYYGSGSVPQTTNSYGYDASGNRILLNKGGTVLTNSVSPGYQITTVKNGSATVESYGYDTGGRITTITRDSQTLNLGYNSSDQVTAVTNTMAGTWVTYVQDASGRRMVSTNSAGVVRRFMVASTPGTDLESPLLITDSSGAVQQGYVYLGNQPISCYSTGGTASYYLEDGMGSIIGLAPASSPGTGNTTRLFYDGFGNTRSTNGPVPTIATGTGGDFRFQGAWWESGSGLYNMRAREYDARTGRFTSRDPVVGDFQQPESFNPYVYANNNCFVYTDPSGTEDLISLNLSMALQAGLGALRSFAIQQAKAWVIGQVGGFASDEFAKFLSAYLPENFGEEVGKAVGSLAEGTAFERELKDVLCKNLGLSWLHFEVGVNYLDGRPVDNGIDCDGKGKRTFFVRGIKRPDVIIGSSEPIDNTTRQPNKEWLIAEIKIKESTLNDYKPGSRKEEQLQAICRYAGNYTPLKLAVFIALEPGEGVNQNTRTLIQRTASRAGAHAFVFSIKGVFQGAKRIR